MPNSIRIIFAFVMLSVISGLFLFKNYRDLERNQREFIRQERNTVTRMNYLENIGRNDFNNYTYLLQHNHDSQLIHDTVFFHEFDSLTRVNTGYIADFWLLIKSGNETVELDSFKEYRKKYLDAFSNYRQQIATNITLPEKGLTTSFTNYRNFHSQLMNKQYSIISSFLRRSHETLVNEIKTMIAILLCCMFMAVALSYFAYSQFQKLK